MSTYSMVNGPEMAKTSSIFNIPISTDIAALKVGNIVKVGVQWDQHTCSCPNKHTIAKGHERFWVRLTMINGDYFRGTVANDLRATPIHGLNFGMLMAFTKEHILVVTKNENRPANMEKRLDLSRNGTNVVAGNIGYNDPYLFLDDI